MLFYFDKKFDAERVGARLERVECSKCGCEYFYELRRVGKGRGFAPYRLGQASAARLAHEKSAHDLAERLTFEADLVPCPRCNWINDELVEGYRRGRYRRLGAVAVGVGVIGTAASLIAAWFISIGPAADRAALPYCLFGGPMVFISSAAAMISLRRWLRS